LHFHFFFRVAALEENIDVRQDVERDRIADKPAPAIVDLGPRLPPDSLIQQWLGRRCRKQLDNSQRKRGEPQMRDAAGKLPSARLRSCNSDWQ